MYVYCDLVDHQIVALANAKNDEDLVHAQETFSPDKTDLYCGVYPE